MYRLFKPVHPLILASNSPRRHEILTNLGIPFKVFHRKVHAEYSALKNPEKFVVALAEQKSHEPAGQISEGIVVTADTIVYIDKTILGKPGTKEEAAQMIRRLQGRTHQVYTGICLTECMSGVKKSTFEVTAVVFSKMTEKEIEWYVDTGEYRDKAGAYAIQGTGSLFVSGINGCFYNVVGFPVHAFFNLYREIILLKTELL